MNTLMVCEADSPPYREAMRQFLTEQLGLGKDAHAIADELNLKNTQLSTFEHAKAASRIELPVALQPEHEEWTASAVIKLIELEGIEVPPDVSLLVERRHVFDLKTQLQETIDKPDSPRPIGRGFLITQERFCFTVRCSGNRLGYRIKVPRWELLR